MGGALDQRSPVSVHVLSETAKTPWEFGLASVTNNRSLTPVTEPPVPVTLNFRWLRYVPLVPLFSRVRNVVNVP